MKLTFLGAAGEVTGSQHLVEVDGRRILLDCGLFQGPRAAARRKNEVFRCEPKKLDAVVLSHAHIDHCGNLPGLYRAGFRGPVFSTPATADVAELMLLDSAKIQSEDVRYLATHLKPGHPPIEPLYHEEHVRGVMRQFEPLDYHDWHELAPDVRVRFADAGHIFGSAIVELEIEERGDVRRLVFTGDLGRRGLPLLRDPEPVEGCDVLICECTYGNRVHPPPQDMRMALLRILDETVGRGGRLIIPAFALGRTQQILYFLNELSQKELSPEVPVFVDSPLSSRLTPVYSRHPEILDAEARDWLRLDDDLFDFPGLRFIQSQRESASLNYRKGPFVVISASGMCENGRIVHHLKHAVADERNTVLIIGWQAPHTLGRRLVERQPRVRIFDRELPLKARVEVLNGLSGHADAGDFKWWFEQLARVRGIGQAFLVHGEAEPAAALAAVLNDYCDEDAIAPRYGETFEA
ncbi:MAG: MBL fold metallo-hydrolase [Planctomycetales bacterium]